MCRRAGEKAGELGITICTHGFSAFTVQETIPWSLVSSCVDTFLKGGHMEFGACTQLWNYLYIKECSPGHYRSAACKIPFRRV